LEAIAEEADAIAMRYFRAMSCASKGRAMARPVTQADRSVEEMARARVAGSALALTFWVKKWAAAMRSLRALRGEPE